MKTWFITGASRGAGALYVKEALDRGDNVVATARDPQALTEKFGARPNLLAVKLDVTNEEQAREAVRQAVERFGRIDVLINNAGFGVLGAVEEISGAEVEAVYRTNVFGLLSVTRCFAAITSSRFGTYHQYLCGRRISKLVWLGRLCLDEVRG